MIDRSKWSLYCLAIVVLCITCRVEAQDASSTTQSAPAARQGEKETTGEIRTLAPSQKDQPKHDTQSEKNADETERKKGDEPRKNDQQAESQPRSVDTEKQRKHIVSQSPIKSLSDQAPPAARDYGAANAHIGLGLEIDTVWNTDPGFDLLSEDDVSTQVGVWFSYDLLQITEQLTLAGEVGLGIGGVDRDPQENLDLTWSMSSFKTYLAANLRLKLFPWMLPHLKVGCGALFGTLEFELKDRGLRQTASEETTSPLGTIGAGVTFQTPTRMFESSDGAFASLSLGLLMEAGYTIASSMSLTLKTDRDEAPIENRTAALGELDLSGPYIRTSVLVRF